MRIRQPPAWMLAAAVPYLLYFGLLVTTDLLTPGATGILVEFSDRGVLVGGVAPQSPGDRAGIRVGDRIVRWNGWPLAGQSDWIASTLNRSPDGTDTFEIERDGVTSTGVVPTEVQGPSSTRVAVVSVRAVQLATLLFALVIASRRHDRVALLGAWTLAVMAVFSLPLPDGLAVFWRSLPSVLGWIVWVPFLSTLVLPAVLFSFSLAFPRPFRWPGVVRAAIWAPMLAAATPFALLVGYAVYRPAQATSLSLALPALFGIGTAYVVAAGIALLVQHARLEDQTDRRRIRVLLSGLAIAGLVGLPLVLYQRFTGARAPLFATPNGLVGALLLLTVPLSFWYAILRHRLFGLSVIVRQSIRYALAKRLVLALAPAFGLVLLIDLVAHRDEPMVSVLTARSWTYAALGFLALTAHLRREPWLEALDRRFFRERYDARRLLNDIVQQLNEWQGLSSIGQYVVSEIERAMHAEFVAILVCETPQRVYRALAVAPESSTRRVVMRPDSKIVGVLHLLGHPVALSDSGWLTTQLPTAEAAELRAAHVELIVPSGHLPSRDVLLVLGPKRSEEPYGADDRELLASVAASITLLVSREAPPPVEASYAECEACGRCYDAGPMRCAVDETPLTLTRGTRHLAERYRLDRRLGRGGMGTVYAAFDTELARAVAAKLIREDLLTSRDVADRFRREARLAAGFAHPNVVTVYDFGILGATRGYLIMELLDGVSLRELLTQTGRIDPPRTIRILGGICSALDEAHRRRLVHRDVKPENIFIVHPGPSEVAKLVDFGIAYLVREPRSDGVDPTTVTAPGLVIGTPRYMAPERLRGGVIQPASDLWSLALVAYEMLTGMHPFQNLGSDQWLHMMGRGDVVSAVADGDMPASWRHFFARALSFEPDRRPPTAGALLTELEAAINGHGGDGPRRE